MGYFTSHDLEVVQGDNSLIAELLEGCEEARYSLCENGDCYGETKWYHHQEDLKAFSIKHPTALFKLSGEGEENGDIWDEYYSNGKIQVCKATIVKPDFNPDLLT